MIYLQIFIEFFIIGLLAVGGGLATIPFLNHLGETTGWFTIDQLTNMIAVAQSAPGPVGVNIATYVGYETAGIPGAFIAPLGLVTPSIVIILTVAAFLQKFRSTSVFNDIFYGIRPASTALIAAACWSVISLSLIIFSPGEHSSFPNISFQWESIAIAAAILLFTHLKWTKKCHPILWIGLSAIAGIILEL